jgi:hypothetical protein
LRLAGLEDDQFAVLTSDNDLNALGSGLPHSSPVLFTTQQQIDRRSQGKLLADVQAFRYHGQPRVVRVWDETLDPAKAVTLSRDDLHLLVRKYRHVRPELSAELEALSWKLTAAEDDAPFDVPDVGSEHGLNSSAGLSLLGDSNEEEKTAALKFCHCRDGLSRFVKTAFGVQL